MPTTKKVANAIISTDIKTDERLRTPINPRRTVHWIGAVNGCVLFEVTEKIQELIIDSPTEPIHLVVTSHGGPTGVGMSFYDTMRSVYQPNLHTIGSGDVDSSGIIVFMTGTRRSITQNTTLLLHLAGRTFESGKRFTTPEMESIIKEDKLKDFQYASVIADRSEGKLTIQEVLDLMAKNTVLTAAEAVNLGLAHQVLS